MKRLICTLLWILFVFGGYSQIGVYKSVIADTVKAKDYRFQQLPNYSVYNALTNITSGESNLATPPGNTAARPTVPSGKIVLRFNTDSNALEYGNSSGVWKTLGTSTVQSIDTSSISNFGLKVRSQFTGTSPILYSGVTGNISIQPATSGQAGYLAQSDWIAFNSKLGDPGSNGFLVRTSLSTTAARQFVAASTNVSIVNPTGVAGNPSLDINDTLTLKQLILTAVSASAPTGDSFLYINRTTNLLEVRPAPSGGGGGGTFNKAGGGISFSGDSLFLNQSFTRGLLSGTTPISYNSSTGAISLTTVPISLGGTNSSASLLNNRVMQSSGGAIIEAPAITANRALISDANGIPTHSTVTATELSYSSGVTSALQTQINGKVSSVTGTTNRITVGGTSTNPTVDIASNYVGQNTITTLGTITTGTWNGTAIDYSEISNTPGTNPGVYFSPAESFDGSFIVFASCIPFANNTFSHGTPITYGILDHTSGHNSSFYDSAYGNVGNGRIVLRYPTVKNVLNSKILCDETLSGYGIHMGPTVGESTFEAPAYQTRSAGIRLVGDGAGNWTKISDFGLSSSWDVTTFNTADGGTSFNVDAPVRNIGYNEVSIVYSGPNNYGIKRVYSGLGSYNARFVIVDRTTGLALSTNPTTSDEVFVTNAGMQERQVDLATYLAGNNEMIALSNSNFWIDGTFECWMVAAPVTSSSIQVRWQNYPSATQYKIYRATSLYGSRTLIHTGTDNSFVDPGLSSGTLYWYFMIATISSVDTYITYFRTSTKN